MSETPCHNPQAESACIASIIMQPWTVDEVAMIVRPDQFFSDIMGTLFSIVCDLRLIGRPIDAISVGVEFDKIEKITGGSKELLQTIMDSVPHGGWASHHAHLVVECWKRRTASGSIELLRASLQDPSITSDDAIGAVDSEIRRLMELSQSKPIDQPLSEVLIEIMDDRTRCAPGLQTGFEELDKTTNGLHPGQLIIVAARPMVGKSVFVGNIVQNLAKRGIASLTIMLEMSKAEFLYRFVCCQSGITIYQLRSGEQRYNEAIADSMHEMSNWPIFINDTIPQTVSQIGAQARLLIRKHAIKLLIVDYLQLITPADQKASREQQVASIARGLKTLAKQLQIPVIGVSQLNRGNDKENRPPQLSDLRESGAIEQDGDGVWLLHRPAIKDTTKDEKEADVIVAKNRQGACKTIGFEWNGSHFEFREKDEIDGQKQMF